MTLQNSNNIQALSAPHPGSLKAKFSRRSFLAFGGATALGAYAGMRLYQGLDTEQIRLEQIELRLENLPYNFHGYRIAFLSDLHVGPCSSISLTQKAIEIVRGVKPDIVILGGDYISMPDRLLEQTMRSAENGKSCFSSGADYLFDRRTAKEVYRNIAEEFSNCPSNDGLIAVYGNHDYFVAPAECRAEFERAAARFLVNQECVISRDGERLQIYGADDFWSGTPKAPSFEGFRSGKDFRLLLSHNPDFISRLMRHKGSPFDFALAGHTHGGQVKLPLLGALHYNVEDSRLAEGLFKGDRELVYTTRGIGTVGLPFRLNCPPEVTVFTMLPA